MSARFLLQCKIDPLISDLLECRSSRALAISPVQRPKSWRGPHRDCPGVQHFRSLRPSWAPLAWPRDLL